jgi:hypothetical protein
MKARVRQFMGTEFTEIVCESWGVTEDGVLVFRDEAGEVVRLVRSWSDVEFVDDPPPSNWDDAMDLMEKKRGYCDI